MGNQKSLGVAYTDQDLDGSTIKNATLTNCTGASSVTTAVAAPGVVDVSSQAAAVGVSMTSGTVDAIRGTVTVNSAVSVSGSSYLYGVTGRLIVKGTVDVGSGDVAAVFAKADFNGATLTSGHIAPLQSNIVNPPADGSKVNLVYVESAGGNPINSFFQAFGKSTYVMDLTSNTHTQMSTTGSAGTTTAKGWLKVLVEGVVRYIPLSDSVS